MIKTLDVVHSPHSRRRLFSIYSLLGVFCAVLFCFSIYFFLWQNLNQAKSDFGRYGANINEQLQQTFVINETILDGFAAFLAEVGMQEPFRARYYTKTMMERYPNLYMFQAAQRVSADDIKQFESDMALRMDTDIRVRRFEFGQGMVSAKYQGDTVYYPLVFVEPAASSGFNMLGLDISSIPFVYDAMLQSLRTGLASISQGFDLIDDGQAFVMIKPSLLPGQEVPDQYALLVLKTQALRQGIKLDEPGLALRVHYADMEPILDETSERLSQWEQLLFPSVEYKNSIDFGANKIYISLTKQFGSNNLNTTLFVLLLIVNIMISVMLHVFLRKHYQSELAKQQANQKLYQQANYDRLTGLANRHYFEDHMVRALAGCQRRADKVALLYVDLNDFKEINDTFGHDTGDRVLTLSAAIILDCIRMDDVASRFGGDEFVILLEHVVNRDDAKKVMFRMHEEMSKVQYIDKKNITLSASIGLAMYPEDGQNLDELLKVADNNMYAAKRQGKVLSMDAHNKKNS